MKGKVTRSTIYFDSILHKALKMKAIHTGLSISEIVNDAVRNSLAEDETDLRVFKERENEPTIPYDVLLKRLKKQRKI